MRKPYTLVEILVAVSIIGILTATGLGVTGYVRNKIADTQTRTTFKLIEMALQKYHETFSSYPKMIDDAASPNSLHLIMGKNISMNSTDPLYYKNTLWGFFNDVSIDKNGNHKIRGIRTVTDGSYCKILDGWGRPIFYLQPGVFNSETFDLISFGGDKEAGDGSASSSDFKTKSNFENNYPDELGDDITNFSRN